MFVGTPTEGEVHELWRESLHACEQGRLEAKLEDGGPLRMAGELGVPGLVAPRS